jgi:carboxypeptidase C (cathepsin A)
MKNLKRKIVNVKTGKIIELSDVAIVNLKKMGKFSEYDILPEISKSVTPSSPSIISEKIEEVTEEINSESTEEVTEEPKKKKKKSTEEKS